MLKFVEFPHSNIAGTLLVSHMSQNPLTANNYQPTNQLTNTCLLYR
jgi:hypothetical protein